MPIDVHTAARKGNVSVVTKYVRGGGDLYARDRYGNPPLHVASYHGREACVSALLRAGVDTNALSRTGHTALQFAERKGQKGCVKLLSAPRKKADSDKKRKGKGNDGAATANPADQPPPPPPMGTVAGAGQAADADGGGWHLCHDDSGNAYYYSEITGESVWADPWGEVASSYPVGSDTSQQQQQHQYNTSQADAYKANPTPAGWVMHFDPNTGYAYYLHEATNNSVWADNDGYFPTEGVPDVSGSSGGHHHLHSANIGDGGAGGFPQWNDGAFGGGDRPPPTAPPSFSSSLELAQGQHGAHGGADMYQGAHHGGMAPNKFFGASHPDVLPSSSGGSPMACAPPAMESGGTRSSCTPRQQAAPPTDDGSGAGHDERNQHHHHPHQGANQHSPSGTHGPAHSPHGAASPAAAPGPAVSRSPDVHHHGYGVTNAPAGDANNKQTFRLGFGVVTVEDVLDERGSHRSFSDTDSTRCYPPSSNNGDGAPPLDSSPLKTHAPDTPSPSTTVSPVTVSSETAHHSPTYHGGGAGGSFAKMKPYETAGMPGEAYHQQSLPHPPGQPSAPPPPPQGSFPSHPRSAESPHKGFQDRAGAVPVDYCRGAFANGYPATADRSSSGGGGGQTVGVNADESLARAAEYAMYIGDRKNASTGGGGT